jgi:cytochrome c556
MRVMSAAAAVILVVSTGWTMAAGASLKSIMKSWKANAGATAERLSGDSYDEAAVRTALQEFIADSQAIDARLTGATAANRDIKIRFEKFSADATAAIGLAGAPDQFRASYAKLINDCKSCHDRYAR